MLLVPSFEERPIIPAAISLGASVIAFLLFALSYNETGTLLGMVQLGGLAALGGMTLSLIAALVILGAMAEPGKYHAGRAEFYAFILYTALGGTLMVAANNLLLLYVGIELSSYSTYVLVGYYRDARRSTEAATKYFTLGAVSSALLLYGFSFLFGAGGGFYYDEIAATLALSPPSPRSSGRRGAHARWFRLQTRAGPFSRLDARRLSRCPDDGRRAPVGGTQGGRGHRAGESFYTSF